VRNELATHAARYGAQRPRGEVTLVVEGAAADAVEAADLDDAEVIERAQALIATGKSTRDAAHELAALTGRPRRDVYKLITSARE
jgi:16S rRNA C1402 (ribose-2'-O) methylase RsmI